MKKQLLLNYLRQNFVSLSSVGEEEIGYYAGFYAKSDEILQICKEIILEELPKERAAILKIIVECFKNPDGILFNQQAEGIIKKLEENGYKIVKL